MKLLITCSGGKDSVAALHWMRNNGYKDYEVVFCDTGWESDVTYKYLDYLQDKLNFKLKDLRSKKYKGMIDMSEKKKRFPSSQRRFCTSELKIIPVVDYILDEVKDDFLVVQGIRGAESESRSKMKAQCNYFKYYIEPIEINSTLLPKLEKQFNSEKKESKRVKILAKIEKVKARLSMGKEDPKYHTYRRKEVLKFCKIHATDVFRPIFEWTDMQVIEYIIKNGLKPNPLYRLGMKRVGCFPCIMSGLPEIHQLAERFPERITEIAEHEKRIGSSIFGPDKIPSKFYKGSYPLITDVVRYAKGKYDAGLLFDEYSATSCMSYYGLCEE